MFFIATWYAGEAAISKETAPTFAAARDIARSRLPAHRIRSGATHFRIHCDDGVLLTDSRLAAEANAAGQSNERIRPTTLPSTR